VTLLADATMDALFFLRHSVHEDFEIQHTLRGIAKYMPWIRKVWIFGDRPRFLSNDQTIIEHVPHEYLARIGRYRTPVTNSFIMGFLSSLIPDLDEEFLRFSDDCFIIGPFSEHDARRDRYIVNMDHAKRAHGLWNESLWRTYDFLKRLGYTGYNFEIHAPAYYTKRRVFEAYRDLKDYVTEDRFYGLLGPTAILNHAVTTGVSDLVQRDREGKWVGFYLRAPAYAELLGRVRGKTFLNCDDFSLTASVKRFLQERFPTPCKYEVEWTSTKEELRPNSDFAPCGYPVPVAPKREDIAGLLNSYKLTGKGVLVNVHSNEFVRKMLGVWRGSSLHRINNGPVPNAHVDTHNTADAPEPTDVSEVNSIEKEFGARYRVLEVTNQQPGSQFENRSLDFVYLDGFANGKALIAEIDTWLPKVRAGGVLAGNNYMDCTVSSGTYDIKSSIDKWAASMMLEMHCTGEHFARSWLIRLTSRQDGITS